MIVYGKFPERVTTRAWVDRIAERCRRVSGLPPGLARHGELMTAFIDAAGLSQGVADALFRDDGMDQRSVGQDDCTALLLRLASAVCVSWDSAFANIEALPDCIALDQLPDEIEINLPEGYAHYALYPEAYIEAARRLRPEGPVRVIGIRSIGTGLAALVTVALRSGPPVTIRPVGHPFERRLNIDPALAAELTDDPRASYVVVDEGPGLSGSSLAAVADFLTGRGVSPDQVTFLTSHGGDPGPEAGPCVRLAWSRVQREVADGNALLTEHIGEWAKAILGDSCRIHDDLSAGAWRARLWAAESAWPAIHPAWERRKLLTDDGDAKWLLRFAGLGAIGERKLAQAQALHAAGFGLEPVGLAHGMLAMRWLDDARPLQPRELGSAELTARIGAYIGFRATSFAARVGGGSEVPELFEMARCNAASALGEARAAALDIWRPRLDCLRPLVQPVEVDGRMLPHEWLRTASGELIKTDALDHHVGHDLVGCQDAAWDVVGAALELGLSQEAVAEAASFISGRRIAPELIAFYRPCYLAFRWAQHRMAVQSLGAWPEEARRNADAADHYARLLAREIAGGWSGR